MEVRQAFLASGNQRYIGTSGKLNKGKQISVFEASEAFLVPNPKPQNYRSWQADHVNDLGFYTTIAFPKNPDGIDESTWTTVQDAILGETDVCLKH